MRVCNYYYFYYIEEGLHASLHVYKHMELDFYATVGDITTRRPWRRPNLISVCDWWKEFQFEPDLHLFQVWLTGSYMEKKLGIYSGICNDLDVVLTGPITNNKKLKRLLDRGMEIGFQNGLLVDMFWSSEVTNLMSEFKPYANIRNGLGMTKYSNGKIEQNNYTGDEIYALGEGLHQFVYYEPSKSFKKMKYRQSAGQYLGLSIQAEEFFS